MGGVRNIRTPPLRKDREGSASMLDDVPSLTALGTAVARAAHRHIDDAPAVFDDAIAERLLPGYQRRYLKRVGSMSRFWRIGYLRQTDAFSALRAQVVVRSRYTEDALTEARDQGVARYVVLAAGLDTFALRAEAGDIDVVEIDHPATQRWKRALLKRREITVPAGLFFLPLDFEKTGLTEVWPASNRPDFVSWLGTTYYLSREAITGTLGDLARSTAPGTRLVLDYWRERPPTLAGNLLLWGARFAVALQQEPMRSFFEPEDMEALAADAGWRVREHLTAAEQNARYLEDRSDGLSVPSFAHLLQLEKPAGH
jgi:methyltransferase (TIGR00027 family)